jgi:tetratricopeptide (TPR) repeat protein
VVVLSLFFFCPFSIYSQKSDAYTKATEHLSIAGQMAESNNFPLAKKHYLQANELAPDNWRFQQEAIEFFIKTKDFESLENFLSLSNMSHSNHNGKALKLYYQGILHMQGGVQEFHNAYADFHEAKHQIERSVFPDLDLWADILVACGYAKVVTRTHSSDGTDYQFSILRVEDFMEAYPYYKKALTLDPEHDIALKNLDTVEARILNCGNELPDIPEFSYDVEDLRRRIHLDSIKKDSLNYINKLRSIDLQHLPKRIEQMISLINNYDEIMMVMDISGSMEDNVDWGIDITRFDVMQELSLAILRQARKTSNMGAITVGGVCGLDPLMMSAIGANTRFEMDSIISTITPDGWTPLNRVLNEAGTMFSSANNKKTVLLISDGMDSCREGIDLCDTAVKLNNAGIDLTVFSFLLEGTSYENDFAYQIYECMTEAANGKIFFMDQNGNVKERVKPKKREQFVDFTLPEFINTNRYRVIDCLCEFDWAPVRDSKTFMKE